MGKGEGFRAKGGFFIEKWRFSGVWGTERKHFEEVTLIAGFWVK